MRVFHGFRGSSCDPGLSLAVDKVQVRNPSIDKDALTEKISVLDTLARTEQAMLIDVEIQIRSTGEMRERSL